MCDVSEETGHLWLTLIPRAAELALVIDEYFLLSAQIYERGANAK